jgi:hypothetical protein
MYTHSWTIVLNSNEKAPREALNQRTEASVVDRACAGQGRIRHAD